MNEARLDARLEGIGGWLGWYVGRCVFACISFLLTMPTLIDNFSWIGVAGLSTFPITPYLLAGLPVIAALTTFATLVCVLLKKRITLVLACVTSGCLVLYNAIVELEYRRLGSSEHLSTFIRVLVTEAIPLTYLFRSVRVKNTLVK